MQKQTFRGKSAVIDVGSNSVRLMFSADGKVLYKTLQTTRLGEGIAFAPFLRGDAQLRTADAIADFKARATSEGAEKIYAYATAAVREAENRQEFIALVQERAGLSLDVLSGECEAAYGMDGALGGKDGAVIDVGGASTEIAIRLDGQTAYKKSVPIGVVKIKDVCGRNRWKIAAFCAPFAEEFFDARALIAAVKGRVVAVGGTATTLGAQKADLKIYDGKKVTGTRLTREDVLQYAEDFLTLPVEEIEAMPCMPKNRADVVGGGAAWIAAAMEGVDICSLTVSDEDNLEGYARAKGLL